MKVFFWMADFLLFFLNKMLGKKLYQTWLKQLENGGIWALFHLFFSKWALSSVRYLTTRYVSGITWNWTFIYWTLNGPISTHGRKQITNIFLFFFPFCTSLFVVILYTPFLGVLMVEVWIGTMALQQYGCQTGKN